MAYGIYDKDNQEWRRYYSNIFNTSIADLTEDEDWLMDHYDTLVLYKFENKKEAEEEIQWQGGNCEVRELPEFIDEVKVM